MTDRQLEILRVNLLPDQSGERDARKTADGTSGNCSLSPLLRCDSMKHVSMLFAVMLYAVCCDAVRFVGVLCDAVCC